MLIEVYKCFEDNDLLIKLSANCIQFFFVCNSTKYLYEIMNNKWYYAFLAIIFS